MPSPEARPPQGQVPYVVPQPQPVAPAKPPKGRGLNLVRLTIWVIVLVVVAGIGYLTYALLTGQIKLRADKPTVESIGIANADLELGPGDNSIIDGGPTGVKSALLNSFVIREGAQLTIRSYVEIRAKTIKILGSVIAEGTDGKAGEEDRGGDGGAGASGGGGGGVGASSNRYDAAASGGWGGGQSADVRFGEQGQDGLSKARGVPGKGGAGSRYLLVQTSGKGLGGDSYLAALNQPAGTQQAFKKQGRGGDGASLGGIGAGGQGGAGGTKLRYKSKSGIKNYVLGGGGGGGGGHALKLVAQQELVILGKVSADGGSGGDGMFVVSEEGKEIASSGAGGGGGGGSIVLETEPGGKLTIEGEVSADGGDGGQYRLERSQKTLGNGGGGGTILIVTESGFKLDEKKVHAQGGAGGFVKGQDGQVSVISKLPTSATVSEIALTSNAFSSDGKTGEVELTWSKPQAVEGATLKGRIVRRLASDPLGVETTIVDDKKIDFSKVQSYTDSGLTLGVSAYYRLILYFEVAKGITLPEFSSKVVAVTPEKNLARLVAPQHASITNYGRMAKDGLVIAPTLQSPTFTGNAVKVMWEPISWSGVESIKGYVVYRSVAEDRFSKNTFSYAEPDLDKSLALKVTPETSGIVGYVKNGNEFIDVNVAPGKTYFYRVAAVSGTGGNYLVPTLSGYSEVQSVFIKVSETKTVTVTRTVTSTGTFTPAPTGTTTIPTTAATEATATPTQTFTETFTPTLTPTTP